MSEVADISIEQIVLKNIRSKEPFLRGLVKFVKSYWVRLPIISLSMLRIFTFFFLSNE